MGRGWALLLLCLGLADLAWLNYSLYPTYRAQQRGQPQNPVVLAAGVAPPRAPQAVELSALEPALILPFEGGGYMSRQSHQDLRLLALRLAQRGNYRVELRGHAEPGLPAKRALAQSKKRAHFVQDLLLQVGLDSSRIEVRAVGSREPRAGQNAKGAPLPQRRVEIRVMELVSQ